jgi:adenine-specific DNA methylase
MGGGTPLLEANRLGCNVIGLDINPMAAWVVNEEIEALDVPAYSKAAATFLEGLREKVGGLYKTHCPITGRDDAEVKYFLWVKTGTCGSCDKDYDLFPGYVLAEDSRHPAYVLICPKCGDLNEVEDPDHPGACDCGVPLMIEGPVRRNRCSCPHCGHVNKSPFHREGPPGHRLFALEYYNPQLKDRPGRLFKKPDAADLARVAEAEALWARMRPSFVPDDVIPEGDESSRLHRWGYSRFRELFNARQLLGLEISARSISKLRDERSRRALATNLSDLLRYQNMLCRYDKMALKSLDVFSIHGFPVGYIQVESNLLGIRNGNSLPVGSGGWVNIIEKYTKAKHYCTDPFEVLHQGKKKTLVPMRGEWIGERNPEQPDAAPRKIDIRCASSTQAKLRKGSLDAVFTDPPYFGNVQYGELMEFCYVWLRKLMGKEFRGLHHLSTRHQDELTGNDTADRNLVHFTEGLAAVYTRMARALKPGAPLVFTYHHNKQEPYCAAGVAILDAGLTCSASLPCPAEMGGSIHIHGTESSIVDSVFVCRDRGTTPRAWLFHNAKGLARLMACELAELSAAGMQPTAGDTRCIAFGHLTRMGVWNLRPSWDDTLPTEAKLEVFRAAMDSLATVDELRSYLDQEPAVAATVPGGLFGQTEREGFADAVAF